MLQSAEICDHDPEDSMKAQVYNVFKSNYKTYHCICSPYSMMTPLVVVVVSNDVDKIFQSGHQLVG